MLKITTSEWLTALGNTINKVGVKPTIEVEIGNDYLNNPSDENDMQLQKAIEIFQNKNGFPFFNLVHYIFDYIRWWY